MLLTVNLDRLAIVFILLIWYYLEKEKPNKVKSILNDKRSDSNASR